MIIVASLILMIAGLAIAGLLQTEGRVITSGLPHTIGIASCLQFATVVIVGSVK